ncbi:MAG: Ger(x)C family spore germination protein [Firmicutes bacterium]|nr:Ger(x)C family spore germination protein [Bacillota bacterium]
MIRRYSKILIILVIPSLILTGCWDYQDIDKRSIIITVGVDHIKGDVEFATEVARLVPSAGEAKIAKQDIYKDLSYGKTFEFARVDYDSRRPFPTFLSATRVVVFGPNYAKEGVEPYMNRINKMYDYRKTLLTVVSREPASELIQTKVKKSISVGFLIEDMMTFLSEKGTALYPKVGEILSDISLGDVGYILPYIGKSQESIKYLGLAIMKESKLIGTVDVKNSEGILYLLAEDPVFTEIVTLENDKENKYSFRIKIGDRKIKSEYKEGKPIINVDLELKNQLQYQYYVGPINDEEKKILEKKISKVVKKYITDIIKRSQEEFECDIFSFAKYFRADNPKVYKKIDWSKEYPEIKINVNVKSKIINMNLSDPSAKQNY